MNVAPDDSDRTGPWARFAACALADKRIGS
jgi:hypothetical protein